MNKDEIFSLLTQHIKDVIPSLEKHVFHRDDRLKELGADSVDRVEIMMMSMDSLSLQIPRVELFGAKNLGELVDLLHKKSQ